MLQPFRIALNCSVRIALFLQLPDDLKSAMTEFVVDGTGFEPAASTMPTWRSFQADLPAHAFRVKSSPIGLFRDTSTAIRRFWFGRAGISWGLTLTESSRAFYFLFLWETDMWPKCLVALAAAPLMIQGRSATAYTYNRNTERFIKSCHLLYRSWCHSCQSSFHYNKRRTLKKLAPEAANRADGPLKCQFD